MACLTFLSGGVCGVFTAEKPLSQVAGHQEAEETAYPSNALAASHS